MAFTAKDVQALRQATGAGMMDCKKALEANDGDIEAAKQWLREKGLAASAKRDDRENTQGVVAPRHRRQRRRDRRAEVRDRLRRRQRPVQGRGRRRWPSWSPPRATTPSPSGQAELDDLKITLKEKIELGEVVRIEAAAGNVLDSYLHIQGGRGVNAVLVEIAGGIAELAHDIAVHIAFARPKYLSRDDVPADVVEAERDDAARRSRRNEGKPEAALAEDRRGSPQRLLQGRRPARPAVRQGRQAVGRARCSAAPTIVALRPGRDRLTPAHGRWPSHVAH